MNDNKESEEASIGALLKLLATLVEIVGASVTVLRSPTKLVGNLS